MTNKNHLNSFVTWAEIDLDAIAHNVRMLKQHIGEHSALMAVVKANGYGHGALPVARTALASGATWLAIGRVEEAIRLRNAGITAPILLMCYTMPTQAEDIVRHRLTPTVNAMALAQALSAEVAVQGSPSFPVHLKVDTGMGRFGLLPEETVDFARALVDVPGLRLQGFYTHFGTADEADDLHARRQFGLYQELVQRLEEAGISVPLKHVANSAATLRFPDMHLDLVRCGIATYGLFPSTEVPRAVPLRPSMSLKSHVGRIRTLPAGWAVSYGRTFVAPAPTPVALVPAGYGDGVRRILSNQGQVLIRGRRAPVLGRICMDQFVVNASGIPNIRENDEIVLLGRQGNDVITAEEIAHRASTINYEVVTSILPRVPRIYVRDGEPSSVQLTAQSA